MQPPHLTKRGLLLLEEKLSCAIKVESPYRLDVEEVLVGEAMKGEVAGCESRR